LPDCQKLTGLFIYFDVRDLTKDTLFENSEVLPPREEGICSLRADEDEFYFESYGHFSIHEEMLKVGKNWAYGLNARQNMLFSFCPDAIC